jgi:hypothetical protein
MMFLLIATFGCHAFATTEFNKQWKDHYLGDDAPKELKDAAKDAGCNVCHVKGQDKKKVRNEYGNAIMKYLKAKDFPKPRITAEPEKVKAEILKGFEAAGELKSTDGKRFAEKIKAGELPATDAGL